MRIEKTAWITSLVLLTSLLYGCGGNKRLEGTQVPGQNMSNEGFSSPNTRQEAAGHYWVRRHDCLWTIAGKSSVYGDSFDWPLLFKTNRDQIKDPDLIYPHQDLKVGRDFSGEEMNHAKHLAMTTPKYVPHSKPRETLPVDYF